MYPFMTVIFIYEWRSPLWRSSLFVATKRSFANRKAEFSIWLYVALPYILNKSLVYGQVVP